MAINNHLLSLLYSSHFNYNRETGVTFSEYYFSYV